MLLIINPYIEWDDTQYSKSDLNVYLDNSKSMLAVSNDFLFNDEIKKIFDWADESQLIHLNFLQPLMAPILLEE